jgi:predicted nucleotidyltransferase
MAYFECIRRRISDSQELLRNLDSLSLFGSSVRGDYIDGVSDLDFYAVFKDAS